MIDVDNAITTDQYIASNPLFLYQDNSLESPKQDQDTSVLIDYGYAVGSEHEDISNEALGQIQEGIFGETLQFEMPKWLHGESPWDFNIAFPPFHKVPESPSTDVEEDIDKSAIWAGISAELDSVVRWREDRDGEVHEEKPSDETIGKAKRLASELLDAVTLAGRPCYAPVVTYDYDGYITMVWRNGKHELYLDITEAEIEYTKVWGINIDSEMDSGIPNPADFLTLWDWLLDG